MTGENESQGDENFDLPEENVRRLARRHEIPEDSVPAFRRAVREAAEELYIKSVTAAATPENRAGDSREYAKFANAVRRARDALESADVRARLRLVGRSQFETDESGVRRDTNPARPSLDSASPHDAFRPGDEVADALVAELLRLAEAGEIDARTLNGPPGRAGIVSAGAVVLTFWEAELGRSGSLNNWNGESSSALSFIDDCLDDILAHLGQRDAARFIRDHADEIRALTDRHLGRS